MDGTIIQQGRFTSTGASKTLDLRSGVDWMEVRNITVAAADQTTAVGVKYFWQRGFPAGAMWEEKKSNAAAAANLSVYATTGGFTLVDTTVNNPGPIVAITSISNANPPRVLVSSTAGLNTGDVVRLINVTGGQQLGGYDFTITVIDATHFDLAFMPAIAAATTGSYRVIPYDPYFFPRRRLITSITTGTTTTIQMAVRTTFTAGQRVLIVIPAIFGMPELNNQYVTILSVNTTTNSLVVDVDSTGYTAFAFPITTDGGFTPAQVVPGGDDTATALALNANILGDATENRGILGMKLFAGANSPAGVTSDVIYWVAGKSFSVTNE